jgi:tetratricopeptide (TPR) repeat protein
MSPNFYQKSEVLYKLGIIFAKTNQIEQAISYFQNSILTNTFTVKRKVDTLLKIGLLYEEIQDYTQSLRSYEAALNQDENNYKTYQHMAWIHFLTNNIAQAIDNIKKADKKNKGQCDSFYILGRCYMALDNNKEALENFQ